MKKIMHLVLKLLFLTLNLGLCAAISPHKKGAHEKYRNQATQLIQDLQRTCQFDLWDFHPEHEYEIFKLHLLYIWANSFCQNNRVASQQANINILSEEKRKEANLKSLKEVTRIRNLGPDNSQKIWHSPTHLYILAKWEELIDITIYLIKEELDLTINEKP